MKLSVEVSFDVEVTLVSFEVGRMGRRPRPCTMHVEEMLDEGGHGEWKKSRMKEGQCSRGSSQLEEASTCDGGVRGMWNH